MAIFGKSKFKLFGLEKISFFFLLLFSSCGGEFGTPEHQIFKEILPFESVSFEFFQTEFLTPYCVSCHSWAGNEVGVLSRITPGAPESSPLYTRVADGSMPKDTVLADRERALKLIRQFIMGVSRGSFPAETMALAPNYESLKFHLLEKSCLACHGENLDPGTFTRLDTYERFRRKAKKSLRMIKLTTTDPDDEDEVPMPPPGEGERVSPEVIEVLEKWIQLGYPE